MMLCTLSACVNTKKLDNVWLYKKQIIFEKAKDKNGQQILFRDSISKPCIVKLDKKDEFVNIEFLEGAYKRDTLFGKTVGEDYSKFFFPLADNIKVSTKKYVRSEKLRYLEISSIFQALTLPIKVRFAQKKQPYSADGSINLGFAFGWKFTHSIYKNYYQKKGMVFMKQQTKSFSITPGVFAGPTVLEITTLNSNATDDRKVLGLTYGAMVAFGVNRFNFGLASGIDYIVQNKSKNWIYNGKPWIGVTIAIDFIE